MKEPEVYYLGYKPAPVSGEGVEDTKTYFFKRSVS